MSVAPLPSSSSPEERIEWFTEQARRAYLNARARGVKWPSLAPEVYFARSSLRFWQGVKFRRESGFTIEEAK